MIIFVSGNYSGINLFYFSLAVIALVTVLLIITHLIQKYNKFGVLLSVLIVIGIGAIINGRIKEMTYKMHAEDCINSYVFFLGFDYNTCTIGSSYTKDQNNYDELRDFYPEKYISQNINNIGTIVDSYIPLQDGKFGFKDEIIFIEKCSKEEIRRVISDKYGAGLIVRRAYRAEVHYSFYNASVEYTDSIPVICGMIGNKWYILDDFSQNGMVNTVDKINKRSDFLDQYNKKNTLINDKNIFDDSALANKASITDAIGGFVDDSIGRLSDEEEKLVEEYLIKKYEETGVRMYIVFSDSDDNNYITNYIDTNLLGVATSPSIAFCRSASDSKWFVRWNVPENHSEKLQNNYEQIANAYLISGSSYDRVINVIDKAYEIYGE